MKTVSDIPNRSPAANRHWRKQVLRQIREQVPPCLVQDGWWLDRKPEPRENR